MTGEQIRGVAGGDGLSNEMFGEIGHGEKKNSRRGGDRMGRTWPGAVIKGRYGDARTGIDGTGLVLI